MHRFFTSRLVGSVVGSRPLFCCGFPAASARASYTLFDRPRPSPFGKSCRMTTTSCPSPVSPLNSTSHPVYFSSFFCSQPQPAASPTPAARRGLRGLHRPYQGLACCPSCLPFRLFGLTVPGGPPTTTLEPTAKPFRQLHLKACRRDAQPELPIPAQVGPWTSGPHLRSLANVCQPGIQHHGAGGRFVPRRPWSIPFFAHHESQAALAKAV